MKALDPQATFPLYLDCDTDKPESDRPALIYRPLTCREWSTAAQAYDGLETLSAVEAIRKLVGIASIGLVGWRNVRDAAGNEIAFDVANLDTLLTSKELYEVIGKRIGGSELTVDDRKN